MAGGPYCVEGRAKVRPDKLGAPRSLLPSGAVYAGRRAYMLGLAKDAAR